MAIEIERKFLVLNDDWRKHVSQTQHIRQGYVAHDGNRSVRIRRVAIKGQRFGLSRLEFEYEIPVADADEMLGKLCIHTIIEKIRHTIIFDGCTWQIDVFSGPDLGVVIAEVELAHPDQRIMIPNWVGDEVTRDGRYRNSSIAARRSRVDGLVG